MVSREIAPCIDLRVARAIDGASPASTTIGPELTRSRNPPASTGLATVATIEERDLRRASSLPDPRVELTVLGVRHVGKLPQIGHHQRITIADQIPDSVAGPPIRRSGPDRQNRRINRDHDLTETLTVTDKHATGYACIRMPASLRRSESYCASCCVHRPSMNRHVWPVGFLSANSCGKRWLQTLS